MPRTKNVPVRNKKSKTELPAVNAEPEEEIIDLTLDSPITTKLPRRSRGQRPFQPSVTINLDEDGIIDLDDSQENDKQTNRKSSDFAENLPRGHGVNCPVCFENLANQSINAMTTPCGHVFCEDCLKTICGRKKICSLCQRPVRFDKCIKLHI